MEFTELCELDYFIAQTHIEKKGSYKDCLSISSYFNASNLIEDSPYDGIIINNHSNIL